MKSLNCNEEKLIQLEEWLNCRHCGIRYKAFLSHCPSCGKSNLYHRSDSPSGKRSAKKAVIIGTSVAGLMAVAAVIFIVPNNLIWDFFPRGEDTDDNSPSPDTERRDEPRTKPSPPNPIVPILAPSKPDIDYEELAIRVHELINEEREQYGLLKLDWDSKLANIAEGHSLDMVEKDYFDHVNPDGEAPSDRAGRVGYDCFKSQGAYYTVGIGENIMQGWLYESITYVGPAPIYHWSTLEEIAQSTVEGWMNSEGHRENILTETYDKEGIGVASASDYKLYVTENFC